MDFGKRFLYFQERYRKADGAKWKNKEIERATRGFVTGNYITNLKKGRVENPSYERLRAIAETLGFPPELWYQSNLESGAQASEQLEALSAAEATLADKLNFLFESQVDPDSGAPPTDRRVSDLTFGRVSEDRLAKARAGEIVDLRAEEYFSLSNVFGVDISFWYLSQPFLGDMDQDTMISLRDTEAKAVLNKFHRIENEEDRSFIRDLIDRFTKRQSSESDEGRASDDRQ